MKKICHCSGLYPVIVAVLFLSLPAVSLPAYSQARQQETGRVAKQLDIFNDVMRELDINYVDTLDYESVVETAINQMLRQVDPYTVYYSEKDSKQLKEMTTGQYSGIGAVIQQREVKTGKDGKELQTFIANPYEGLPAQRNGLMAGDWIMSVDGESVKGLKVSEVSRKLRGVPGTTITIEILRSGEKKARKFAFLREEIRLEPVRYYCAYKADSLSQPVGYIAFNDFTDNSARDFERALDDLVTNDHIGSLIIDLRDNGGGLIGQAVDMVNLFVDNTVVVDTKGKHDEPLYTYRTRYQARYPDLPLVIMVNKNTASAAEIVCGALQDLHRATLIGQRTFGKGLVQSIRPIAHNGSIKVTTARYYLPSGRCIQAIDYAERQKGNELKKDTAGGILPDIVINDSVKVDVTFPLYTQNMFFDYATLYRQKHPVLTASATDFVVSDEMIEDFCRFLEEKDFKYETETGKFYKELLTLARKEDLDSATLAQLESFESAVQPDYKEAVYRNKENVQNLLGREIILRYYYQKGELAYVLRFDKELKRALKEADRLLRKP